MQEKSAPVFVVATANRIDSLPPELMRKGRFDEIFFIDLPTAREREEIFALHLEKRRRTPQSFPLEKLAEASSGFSGAEIEQVVVSALAEAFADGLELAPAHVFEALENTLPLSVTMAEEVAALRDWAQKRTRPAT
jgi:SpoVK/Ycf46/Vps4 family AAA+-type ATPase